MSSDIPQEDLEQMAKNNYVHSQLACWFDKNFEQIFKKFGPEISYVVAVADLKNPDCIPSEIHTFRYKHSKEPFLGIFGKPHKGALNFITECDAQPDKVAYCQGRDQHKVVWTY